MQNDNLYFIPPGLRPVRTHRAAAPSKSKSASTSTSTAAPPAQPSPVPPSSPKVHGSKCEDAGRDYSLYVARKLANSRALRLPPPRRLLGCCCFSAPKVEDPKSASAVELQKLLLKSDKTLP